MIIPPSLLPILAIFPIITKQQQQPKIELNPDWSKCATEVRCMCWDGTSMTALSVAPTGEECNIGAQNKLFTEETAVFQLQILDQTDVGNNAKLMLYQGDLELFGCEIDEFGKVKLAGKEEVLKEYKISLFEDRSRLKKGAYLCAVKMNNVVNFEKYTKKRPHGIAKQTLKLIGSNPKDYVFAIQGNILFNSLGDTKCDPYSFSNLNDLKDYHVLPLLNRDKDKINCKDAYGIIYNMKYIHGHDTPKDMIQLECNADPEVPNSFIFQIAEGDAENPTKTSVIDPEMYTFFCAANINEVCEDPKIECSSPPCPEYHAGTVGTAATLNCPDKKWLIGNEYVILEKEPICQADIISNPNKAEFFITRPSESIKKVDKNDRCFEKYDCKLKSSFVQLGKGTVYNSDTGVVTCKFPMVDLSIDIFDANETWTASNLTCEPSTGLWRNTTLKAVSAGEPIVSGAQVNCYDDPENLRKTIGASLSEAQVRMITGLIGAGIILATVLIALGAYCYRKNRSGVLGKRAWRNTKRAKKLQKCEQIFGKVLKPTPTTTDRIVFGLRQMQLMLDTETADVDCWILVYSFLTRIHGTIVKMDHQVWRMFCRYLYLQAKQIIDKHGWISPKPIRRKKQKGLIRAVAIRLLGFAMDDPKCLEAFELLEDGFRKLGFLGLEQYPHCGVLWSVISHVRPLAYAEPHASAYAAPLLFDYAVFAKQLRRIAMHAMQSMPQDEVIPAFGQVAEQAAFALGGYQNFDYQRNEAPDIIKKEDSNGIAGRYFAGMCGSRVINPSNFVFEVCKGGCEELEETGEKLDMDTIRERQRLQYLHKIKQAMTEQEFDCIIDQTMRLMAYYGRGLDAKKLEGRFMPAVHQPSAALSELLMEQQCFENTVEKQLEDVRHWYADHTDKKEFKEKPDYTMSAKVKLDNRINISEDKEEDAEAPAGDKGSDSQSNVEVVAATASNSTNDKLTPPPAAAPAAL